MRELAKKVIKYWPWPLTVNERYDRQTKAILQKICRPESVCIDVGCFKGDILRLMIRYAPEARHIAFEPIPTQFEFLKATFGKQADVYPFALGNENKVASFQFVVSNPTYSGLRQRKYKGEEKIESIRVAVRKMDDIVSQDIPVAVIKIDVEGGEYDVLQGASGLLKKWHPYIIFEHGIGAADMYGIKPGSLYDLLVHQLGYQILLMGDFLNSPEAKGFSRSEFEDQFWKGKNCYFIAAIP
jgi:FkbM family methyltransferase